MVPVHPRDELDRDSLGACRLTFIVIRAVSESLAIHLRHHFQAIFEAGYLFVAEGVIQGFLLRATNDLSSQPPYQEKDRGLLNLITSSVHLIQER